VFICIYWFIGNFHPLFFFLGLGPLWGIGVTSAIRFIFTPAALIARSAASRPDPGPFK
jgi:hypothetical protein